jgi:hypothetical protein
MFAPLIGQRVVKLHGESTLALDGHSLVVVRARRLLHAIHATLDVSVSTILALLNSYSNSILKMFSQNFSNFFSN